MALSIRNQKVEKLAREVAAVSGENITQSILHALEDRIERLKAKHNTIDLAKEIMNISKRCSALPDKDSRSPEEILAYNSNGVFE